MLQAVFKNVLLCHKVSLCFITIGLNLILTFHQTEWAVVAMTTKEVSKTNAGMKVYKIGDFYLKKESSAVPLRILFISGLLYLFL